MSLQLAPGMSIIELIVKLVASTQQFTDIHIEEGEEVAWHIPFGFKNVSDNVIFSREEIESFLDVIKPSGWKTEMEKNGAIDHSAVQMNCRLRINAYFTREQKRISLSIRKHPLEPMKIDETPLSAVAKKMLQLSNKGLFIVTGPTGAAKTTTLAAIVDYFNKDAKTNGQPRRTHIVTLEEPIEYEHTRVNAIISHKSVGIGKDCPTFAQGLRAALREKPDIILIGEVRDRETAEVMFHAAESGHLILATMHTSSATQAVSKILSFFPDDESVTRRLTLSNILIGISSQVMLPMEKQNGFKVISETLINNNAPVSKMIADNKIDDLQSYLDKGQDGSTSLNIQLHKLYETGEISGEIAVKSSYDPIQMMIKVRSSK